MKWQLRSTVCAAAMLAIAGCADLAFDADRMPADMEIAPPDTVVRVGDASRLRVKLFDRDGKILREAPSWAPVWSTDNPEAIIVQPSGALLGVRAGVALLVTAQLAGMEASTRLRINPRSLRLSAPVVYLNQVVQNPEGSVPLLAGRRALLRVFATGDEINFYEPNVRAEFYRDGQLVHRELMTPLSEQLPAEVDESRIDGSHNAVIPGHLIQPGLEMVIEIDPEGVVPRAPGSRTRIPAEGRMPLRIVALPVHEQVLVPTILNRSPDERVFDWTRGVNAESPHMQKLRTLMPIADITVRAHETMYTDADLRTSAGWSQWLREARALYEAEGEDGYYYGVVQLPYEGGIRGIAYLGHPASVGENVDYVFAHEVGHSMNLLHAPCGGARSTDPGFPYSDGRIGMWGYDFAGGELVDPGSSARDLMGYCFDSIWVSDYFFVKAMEHRLATEGRGLPPAREPESTLMLWGSASAEEMLLEPAFLIEAPPSSPAAGGPYRLEGFGPAGERRFSFDFTPTPVAYGGAHFHFNLPYDPTRDGTLERVVLSGPGGETTLTASSTPPMAIIRNPASGQIRAFLRDWNGTVPPGVGGNMDILFSHGLPGGVR